MLTDLLLLWLLKALSDSARLADLLMLLERDLLGTCDAIDMLCDFDFDALINIEREADLLWLLNADADSSCDADCERD